MVIGGLLVPELLLKVLDGGRWPRTSNEASKQNLHSMVSKERLQKLAPEESHLYLYPPPFHTVSQIMTGPGADFYSRFGAVTDLIPQMVIEIGDFGLGSDAPILLDYRDNLSVPRVIRLLWPGDGVPNRWVIMAPDFHAFIKVLGL